VILFLCQSLSFDNLESDQEKFNEFLQKFDKIYTPEEYQNRFAIFRKNLRIAAEIDGQDELASFGITKFMDLSPEEFEESYLMKNFQTTQEERDFIKWTPTPNSILTLPESYNWVPKGVVTPVYDQGSCGSCWAFSTTENIESFWALAGNNLTQLSMQQLVSCDITSLGCNGGNPPFAYRYIKAVGGLESLIDYPYLGHDSRCEFNRSLIAASISGFQRISDHSHDNETAAQVFTFNHGPPSVCVDAKTWQYYTGGIMTGKSCGKLLDHCVQITGWEIINGTNAWIVRNSWGTNWGPYLGYLYVEMFDDVCGIGQEVTSSII